MRKNSIIGLLHSAPILQDHHFVSHGRLSLLHGSLVHGLSGCLMNRCGAMVSKSRPIFDCMPIFLIILAFFGTTSAAPLNARYPWYVAASGDWCYRNPHRLGQLELSPRPNNQLTLQRDATINYGMGVGNTASKQPQWTHAHSVGATPAKGSSNFFTGQLQQAPTYNFSPPIASEKLPEENSDTVPSAASDLSAFASAASPNVVYYAPINYKGDAAHASHYDAIIPSQHQHKHPPIWPRSMKKDYGAYQPEPPGYHDSTSSSYSTDQSHNYDESYEGDDDYGSYGKDGSYSNTYHSKESGANDGSYASHQSYGDEHHGHDDYASNEVSTQIDHVDHSKAGSAEESVGLLIPYNAKEENNRPDEDDKHQGGKMAETGKQGKGQEGNAKPTTSIAISGSSAAVGGQGKKPTSTAEREKPGTTSHHEAKTEGTNKQKQHSFNQSKEKKGKGQKNPTVKEKAQNETRAKVKHPATFLATANNDSSATTNLTATTAALPISADQLLIQPELKLPDPGPKMRCELKSALDKCSPIFKCEEDIGRTGTCWREDNVDLTVFDDLTSSCKKVSALPECGRGHFCTGKKTRGWHLVGGPCSQLAYFCDPNRFLADDDDESNTFSCHGHEIVHPRTKSHCVKPKEIHECASLHKIGTIV